MREVLKWAAGFLTGIAYAIVAYVSGHLGDSVSGMDPVIAAVVVAVITRLSSWAVSKLPATPTPPPPTI